MAGHGSEEERRRMQEESRLHRQEMESARRELMLEMQRARAELAESRKRIRREMEAARSSLHSRMSELREHLRDVQDRAARGAGRRRRNGDPGHEPDAGGVPVEPNRPKDLSGGAAAELDFGNP